MSEFIKKAQLLFVILLAATLVLAGCGGGDKKDDEAATTTTTDDAAAAATTTPAPQPTPEEQAAALEAQGSAAGLGVAGAGGPGATGTVDGIDLGALNEEFKGWTVAGFDYAKTSNANVGDFDAWARARLENGVLQTVVDKLPEGYVLELRGHADKSGPERPVGSKPGNIKISEDRAKGVFSALARNGLTGAGKVVYNGVGSSQWEADPDATVTGRSAKNRRVTFHIVQK